MKEEREVKFKKRDCKQREEFSKLRERVGRGTKIKSVRRTKKGKKEWCKTVRQTEELASG